MIPEIMGPNMKHAVPTRWWVSLLYGVLLLAPATATFTAEPYPVAERGFRARWGT